MTRIVVLVLPLGTRLRVRRDGGFDRRQGGAFEIQALVFKGEVCGMSKFSKIGSAPAALLLLVAGAALAEPVGPNLTPKLQDLLRQEMASVLVASQDILGALATGDHAAVAERAQQIHDSFILRQSLTEQDKQDLMAAVPPEFVELDRSFHETAAALAVAARAKDVRQELITFARMTEACVACHGRFASDRFPGLAQE
jgi:hypothetical protein